MENKLLAAPLGEVRPVLQCVTVTKAFRPGAGAGPTFRPRLPQLGPLLTMLQRQPQLAREPLPRRPVGGRWRRQAPLHHTRGSQDSAKRRRLRNF